ncbi:MAG TPA: PAS domain-containing protein [Rhodocyclaceae bacterium]|nr:PAS domain-containing protein [Rhodocyclaceae bacterium]
MNITAEHILQQAGDALIYADQQGIIRVWNAAAERLFGFTANEAIGQSLDLIIPEKLRAAHWRGFDAAMASGQTKHAGAPTRTKALTRSGETIYAEMSFAVVRDEASGEIGSVAMARICPPKS